MKKLIVTSIISILLAGLAVGLDFENKGIFRLKKKGPNNVALQRVIKDIEDVNHVVWEKSYGLVKAKAIRDAAFSEYNYFNDMNDVEKIAYVDKKKAVAGIKLVKWNAVVNKFDDPIDTE